MTSQFVLPWNQTTPLCQRNQRIQITILCQLSRQIQHSRLNRKPHTSSSIPVDQLRHNFRKQNRHMHIQGLLMTITQDHHGNSRKWGDLERLTIATGAFTAIVAIDMMARDIHEAEVKNQDHVIMILDDQDPSTNHLPSGHRDRRRGLHVDLHQSIGQGPVGIRVIPTLLDMVAIPDIPHKCPHHVITEIPSIQPHPTVHQKAEDQELRALHAIPDLSKV